MLIEFLNLKGALKERQQKGEILRRSPFIRIVNLTAGYKKGIPAIADVSFDLLPNTITAIVGESGSGKTTFIRTINRTHELTSQAHPWQEGSIFIDGQDVAQSDPIELRRDVGYVYQSANDYPFMSIRDNILFAYQFGKKTIPKSEVVEYVLRKANLWDEVKDKIKGPPDLSGGQHQRLCIARALAVEPKVLLLDESTASLDPASTKKIELLLHELAREITVVIVTHNIQQAVRVSDYTAVFYPGVVDQLGQVSYDGIGRLVEVTPTEEIALKPQNPYTEAFLTGHLNGK